MNLNYTYEQDGKFFIGWFDNHPEHPTQAFSISGLEDNLRDIFTLIQEGTLEVKKHGVLEVAG
jgi:hypothetical protein